MQQVTERNQRSLAAAAPQASMVAGKRPRVTGAARPPAQRLLHVFPSFGIGGVPLRMLRVINNLGRDFSHVVIALDNNFDAAARLAADADTTLLPPPRARGMLRGVLASASVVRELKPDLLLTYNWGAIEWALANRLFVSGRHIHFESGFGKEEADRQLRRRVLCRRWALARSRRVVVPSRLLADLAQRVWKLASEQVTYLPNGVNIDRFAAPVRDAIPGFVRRPGELVVGTVAPLRPEKNVGRLLHAFAALGGAVPARLIVAGDGFERAALERLAGELGIADRTIFTGQVKPEEVLGSFDIFALSSDTEQMPNALLEAMAAGCAVAAVDVGDVKTIVYEGNREFIVPRDDPAALPAAIRHLLRDGPTRASLGRGNRERAIAEFSEDRMFAAYHAIFAGNAARGDTAAGQCPP